MYMCTELQDKMYFKECTVVKKKFEKHDFLVMKEVGSVGTYRAYLLIV